MCGLFGVLSTGDAHLNYSESLLINSLKLIAHRGPDYLGHKISPDAFLSHARLSIIDLDARSHQPMISNDQRFELVFNGEIYNYQKLAAELKSAGVSFRTNSDTEVILEGCRFWGVENFLKKSNGMFAFVLLDRQERLAFFGRDRLGEKPLFYKFQNQNLIFSSEMAPIMNLGRNELSATGLDAYMTLGFPLPNDHLIKGVKSVPAGHFISFNLNSGKEITKSYWEVRHKDTPRLATANVDELEEKVIQSIKSRMIADVPLCGFLSGGVDSSLIAAITSKNSTTPYRTYCIGYEGEEKSNEFEFARMVADQYKLDHQELRISMSDAKDRLLQLVDKLDEPISNWVWLPLHFLAEKARSDGYKVTMVGEGADEVFFGYNSMTKSLKELDKGISSLTLPMLGLLSNIISPYVKEGHKSYDLWRRVSENEPRYMGTSFAFPATQRPRLAGIKLIEQGRAASGYEFIQELQTRLATLGPFDNVDVISYTEIYAKMIEVLVRRVDRITMLHGLEARAPFLDHELIEYVFRLEGSKRLLNNDKKGWLKQVAYRHIPSECITRKKQGFSFPFKNWLHKDFKNIVIERFQEGGIFKDQWLNKDFAMGLMNTHLAGKRDYSPQIWHLYTLAVWYDRWIKL